MTLNRYRLKHLAAQGHRGACHAQRLLEHPDRLIGLILLGNNLVNNFASALVTLIVLQLYGEGSLALGITVLTVVMLITSEVAPKTLGALYPERLAFPAAYVYIPLGRILHPLVWMLSISANGLLRLFGVVAKGGGQQGLSREELRTVMLEAGSLIAKPHQDILLRVLDLELATVEDLMLPRQVIEALDLNDPPAELCTRLASLPYSRIPVYEGQIDQIRGVLPLRKALQTLGTQQGYCSREALERLLEPAIFIAANTPLHKQLLRFREGNQRLGLVVDEYGDLLGLITLGDILEAIVGEFADAQSQQAPHFQPDGSIIVPGQISLRELNRLLHLQFPVHGPRTLNGLILDWLEDIPGSPVGLRLAGYALDLVEIGPHAVLRVRIYPQIARSIAD